MKNPGLAKWLYEFEIRTCSGARPVQNRAMKFTRMGHAAIHVSDIDKSLSFYQQILGFKSNWEGDPDWANVKLGNDDLSLVLQKDAVHPPHLGLRVSSFKELEQAHAELRQKGVKVEDLNRHRDGTASFYFFDPDSNVLEVLWDPADTLI